MEMVELESLEADADIEELKRLITNHHEFTGSTVAKNLLDNWQQALSEFVKVMPTDYKRVLEERKEQVSAG